MDALPSELISFIAHFTDVRDAYNFHRTSKRYSFLKKEFEMTSAFLIIDCEVVKSDHGGYCSDEENHDSISFNIYKIPITLPKISLNKLLSVPLNSLFKSGLRIFKVEDMQTGGSNYCSVSERGYAHQKSIIGYEILGIQHYENKKLISSIDIDKELEILDIKFNRFDIKGGISGDSYFDGRHDDECTWPKEIPIKLN